MHVARRGQRASRASSFHRARHDGVVMMMEDGRLRRIPHFSPSVGAVIQLLRKKQSLSKHLLWWFSNKRAWTTTHPRECPHYHSFSVHFGRQFICSQPRTNFSSLAEQQFFLMLHKLVKVDVEIHLASRISWLHGMSQLLREVSFLQAKGQGHVYDHCNCADLWRSPMSHGLLLSYNVSNVSEKICSNSNQRTFWKPLISRF